MTTILAIAGGGCAGAGDLSDPGAGGFDYDGGLPGESDGGSGGGLSDSGPPPETEENRTFNAPKAGERYVYIANPLRDSVAVIDSLTLAIDTVDVGDGPVALETLPERDSAIVVNVGSSDATILYTDEGGTHTTTHAVVQGANAVAVAPDGAHAVVYFDTDAEGSELGSGSFQEVSVVTLADGESRSVHLSVGFRPIDVTFSSDGEQAFVITEDGVSVIALSEATGPGFAPPIALGDGVTGALSRDVSITSDGRYALARREDDSALRLIELRDGTLTSLVTTSPVTDLDLAPNGEFAIAVLRAESAVLRIPIPEGFVDPLVVVRTELPDAAVGSVSISPDGSVAVLYTTLEGIEQATLLDLEGDLAPRSIRLRKSVRAVALSPDSGTALVFHSKAAGDPEERGIDLETRMDRSYGYTVIDFATAFAKLQLTDADIGPAVVVPDGTYGFLLLRDDLRSIREVQRVALRSLIIDQVPLGSPPISLGIVAGTGRAFVGQRHPEGRITFIDWATAETESVTGFELNSRIVE